MAAPDYRRIFRAVRGAYVVLTPDLVVVAANDDYLSVTMTRHEDLVGRPLFDVFPANPSGPASSAEADLRASVARVVETGRLDTQPVHKYDLRRPGSDGAFEERYWSPFNAPVLGDDGRVALVLHGVEDVTEQVRARRRMREMAIPVVTVREGVLLLPLIGDVDRVRSGEVVEAVLDRIVADRARAIIIDVAGVQVMDTFVADSLIKAAQGVRLLGAHTILTGIGANASRTMVGLGIDLSMLHTRSRLTEGIDLALQLVERGVRGGS